MRDRKPQGFRDTPKVTENWQIQGLTSETPSNFGLVERPLPSPDSSLVQAFDGGVDWGPLLEPGGEGGRVPSAGCVKRWNAVSWAALWGSPIFAG